MKREKGKSLNYILILQKYVLVTLIIALLIPYASALKDLNSGLYQYYFATLVEERDESEMESETGSQFFTFESQTAFSYPLLSLQEELKTKILLYFPLTGFTEHELPPPELFHI